jgi:hypothetical protein
MGGGGVCVNRRPTVSYDRVVFTNIMSKTMAIPLEVIPVKAQE